MPTSRLTTSLELAEVVRKTASLGATYPQIVAILEDAKRQQKPRRRAGRRRGARFPIGSTSKPSWARTSTAKRDDSRQDERREKIQVQAGAGCSESLDETATIPPDDAQRQRMHPRDQFRNVIVESPTLIPSTAATDRRMLTGVNTSRVTAEER